MREPHRTNIIVQLANRTIAYPKGIVENMLAKVDKFIFSNNFVVLYMEEDEDVPIILWCPFFNTYNTVVEVR